MSYYSKKLGKWIQNPENTQINLSKDSKKELLDIIVEESTKRDARLTMQKLIDEMIEKYKGE